MSKVVPYNFLDDLEKEDAIGIDSMSITYVQPADTCSSSDEIQTITLTTQYGCCITKQEHEEGSEQFYFNVEIPEGQHWSVNSGEELAMLVNDFKERIYKRKQNEDLSGISS